VQFFFVPFGAKTTEHGTCTTETTRNCNTGTGTRQNTSSAQVKERNHSALERIESTSLPSLYALPFYDFELRASHARTLLPAALASVPFGFVLVRVRVRITAQHGSAEVKDSCSRAEDVVIPQS